MTRQEPLAKPHAAKLRVKDFLLLSEAGAFDDYARSELIEGEVWVVNAVHSRHARAHALLTVELGIALKGSGSKLFLYTAPSTELSEHSLPEPDIAIGEPDDAKTVQGTKVRLAIEISDASLDFDLGRKARLYAAHGIPEYWVVDVENRLVHLMSAPKEGVYSEQRRIAFGEAIEAATVDGLRVETEDL